MTVKNVDYVSRDDIRSIREGVTKIFVVPTVAKLYSARTQVAVVQDLYGGKFKCQISSKLHTVTITRLEQ